MALKVGDQAPDFYSKDENGQTIRLSDFKGKKLVLFFYPKDDTPTCTTEVCNLRDNLDLLKKAGYQVVGVSADNEKSHRKFIKKFKLNFPLIADTVHQLIDSYDVWHEKELFGKKYMGIVRTTFLIDEEGKISEIISQVKSAEHANQILM